MHKFPFNCWQICVCRNIHSEWERERQTWCTMLYVYAYIAVLYMEIYKAYTIQERKHFYCVASFNTPKQTTESIWKQFCVGKKWFEDKLTICSTSTDWFISLQVLIVFFSCQSHFPFSFFNTHSFTFCVQSVVRSANFSHIHRLVYHTHIRRIRVQLHIFCYVSFSLACLLAFQA